MALTYQANNKTWSYTPEKTDYQTNLSTTKDIARTIVTGPTFEGQTYTGFGITDDPQEVENIKKIIKIGRAHV